MSANRTQTLIEAARRSKGLTYAALGRVLGKQRGSAWRYCLPPDHPDHRRPDDEAARNLRAWSKGRVTIANYADPEPRRPARKR